MRDSTADPESPTQCARVRAGLAYRRGAPFAGGRLRLRTCHPSTVGADDMSAQDTIGSIPLTDRKALESLPGRVSSRLHGMPFHAPS